MTDVISPLAQGNQAEREDAGGKDLQLAAACQAVANDLLLLARFADRELDGELVAELNQSPPRQWFSLDLTGKDVEEAFTLIATGLADFGDPASPIVLDDHAAEYAAIYLTHNYRASPLESFWRDDEGLVRQQAMFAVRDFYHRYGVNVQDWRKRSEDHLAYELSFLAALIKGADQPEDLQGAADFLSRHLLVWNHLFAQTVTQRCRLPFYAGVVLVTALYLDRLSVLIAEATGLDLTPSALNFSTQSLNPPVKEDLTCGDPPKPRVN